ncbi:enoyl-CoA hydratase/isomerase family protein [Roseobacter litoralis]|uniref:enoyl-CoA hydratase/isomerase family protein n=1 Tax=Roseobacter litoralis TaxID=42443 RepID=UPI00249311A6|nr:enoyl-CoA hydratase/isomerase family protein [Roseobacter litoralis]
MTGVTAAKSGALVRLTLNIPARGNALDTDTLRTFESCLVGIEDDPSVRLVVLTGAGDRFFCAGGAFDDWGARAPAQMGREFIRTTNRIFDRLEMMDALTVSYINGAAIGGGLELALATDLRVVHSRATLSTPELSIGAVPGMRGIQRLGDLIGLGRAKELVLFGHKLSASDAVAFGLAHRIEDSLADVEKDYLAIACRQSSEAIASAKQLLRILTDGPGAMHAAHELAGAYVRTTPEADEGLAALRGKRAPDFMGITNGETSDDGQI